MFRRNARSRYESRPISQRVSSTDIVDFPHEPKDGSVSCCRRSCLPVDSLFVFENDIANSQD